MLLKLGSGKTWVRFSYIPLLHSAEILRYHSTLSSKIQIVPSAMSLHKEGRWGGRRGNEDKVKLEMAFQKWTDKEEMTSSPLPHSNTNRNTSIEKRKKEKVSIRRGVCLPLPHPPLYVPLHHWPEGVETGEGEVVQLLHAIQYTKIQIYKNKNKKYNTKIQKYKFTDQRRMVGSAEV